MMQIPLEECHYNLPPSRWPSTLTFMVRSQVCTPTQCIKLISVIVSKKWREMRQICSKKCHSELVPYRQCSGS